MLNEGENTREAPSCHISPPYSASPSHVTSQSFTEQTAHLTRERERFILAEQIGSIGTFDWNIADNQIIWSPALEALYGLPPGGFEGKYENWARYIHPDDLARAEESLRQAVREGGTYKAEFRVIWPDGSIHWLLAKGDLYDPGTAQEKRMLGINIDITERKAIEGQLAWQAGLLKNAHDACIVKDMDGKIQFWNHGAAILYGWPEEEALGQTLYLLLNTQFPQPQPEIQHIIEEQKYWEGELVQTKRDGTHIFVASRWALVETAGTALPLILEVNRDITDLKRALANSHFLAEASKYLSSSLDYQEALAQMASLAVSGFADWCRIDLLEKDGTLSQYTIAPTGYPDPTWLSLSRQQTFTPERRQGVWQVLNSRKSLLVSQVTDQMLVALANNEQEDAWLRAAQFCCAMIVPIILHNTAQGTITFLSGQQLFSPNPRAELLMIEELASRIALAIENTRMYQDLQDFNTNLEALVTQRTEALLATTETLRQINGELERSNQELQDFAHVASHDLQEPLRKIQAFGNLLAEEYGSELGEGRLYIERMSKAAARMQVLINDLMAFARVTTKAQPFELVDLNVIARDVVDDLENRIQISGGQVKVGPLPVIEADAFQMRQMLQNLLGNALKFHRPGVPPIVRISVVEESGPAAEQESFQLLIEDNGIGFDEKYLDRIFTVFQRLHGKNEYEGTGIGLAVVRKIVLRHNGTITAKSENGAGSTFFVDLPITQTIKKEAALNG